jgi:hypothetical protein
MSAESTAPVPPAVSMDNIVALAKRRGFIFQSSEIYGGFNGFFDYGPLGSELKKNIRDCWWNDMVRRRDDIVGIETSIIMHPKVWEASGHVAGFSDPLVDCKASQTALPRRSTVFLRSRSMPALNLPTQSLKTFWRKGSISGTQRLKSLRKQFWG